ncbi:hypothetical protein GJ496_011008 [Pomphorhynchus laevis]|nr:hypothetical protein GJ496_011008 [Pomphorhynchus laevis]
MTTDKTVCLSSNEPSKRTLIEQYIKAEKLALDILDSIDSSLVVSADDRLQWNELMKQNQGINRRRKRKNIAQCDLPTSEIYKDLGSLLNNQQSKGSKQHMENKQTKSKGRKNDRETAGSELINKLHDKLSQISTTRKCGKAVKQRNPKKMTNSNKNGGPALFKTPIALNKINRLKQKKHVLKKHMKNENENGHNEQSDDVVESVSAKGSNFNFNRLNLGSGHSNESKEKGGKKSKVKIIQALEFARSDEAKTDSGKWLIAQKKASGESVVPSENLKKLLKSKEVKKKRSKKEWSKRKQEVAKKRKVSEEKRKVNISKRKDAKQQKKRKRLMKKGHLV